MNVGKLAKIARKGDKILERIAIIIAILILIFVGYSLYNNWKIGKAAALSEDLLKFRPDPDDPATYSLKDLQEINPDVCAWITVKNTHIDYPVVKGEDNMEYINKDLFGEFSYSGTVFLDSQNKRDLSDPYMVIYGHNMSRGAMFGDVEKFKKQSYLEKHRTGYLYGDGFMRKIDFFACCSLNAGDRYVYDVQKWSQGNRAELIEYIYSNADASVSGVANSGDDIVALSTCTEAASNGRILLFGRLGEEKRGGEKKHEIKK